MVNIALTTIILFILFVFPGIVFRRYYFRGPFSSEYFKSSWAEVFVFTSIPGILFQLISFGILRCCPFFHFDTKILAFLLYPSDSESLSISLERILKDVWLIGAYNVFVWLIAAAAGYLLHFLVRKFDLDRKIDVLKFKNDWHYLFEPEDDESSLVLIDVMIKQENKIGESEYENKHIIITGLLEQYKLNSTDIGLEYIVIKNATRHPINWDSEKSGKKDNYYIISGSNFLIPYVQIINMNVTFIKKPSIPETPENPSDESQRQH